VRSTIAIASVRCSTAECAPECNSISSSIRHTSIAKAYGTPLGDYHDNAERFALFCRAVLEAAKIGNARPLSLSRWQTALIPILLKTLYHDDPAFSRTPCILTIHNLGYQGLFPPEILPLLMLPWDLFTMSKLEILRQGQFSQGRHLHGRLHHHREQEVQPGEFQTAEYGFGLEGVLRARGSTISGILNAVDYVSWNPQADQYVAAPYSADDLSGKAVCKADLLKEFGLAQDTQLPVVGIVSRFAAQKDSISFSRWPTGWRWKI